jgi:hypothetical protein
MKRPRWLYARMTGRPASVSPKNEKIGEREIASRRFSSRDVAR